MNNKELDNIYLNGEEYSVTREEKPAENEPRRTPGKNNHGMKGLAGLLAGIIIGVLICLGIFSVVAVKSHATSVNMDYKTKIDLILDYLDLYYLNELDDQMIEDALAKGLMQNIGDDYAEYYTTEEFEELINSMNGEYAGIGVEIVMDDDGHIEVYRVFDNSPAQEAGVQIRDFILEAGGQRDFENLDDLVAIVRGEPGTTVDIVIGRDDEEIPMTIERRQIEIESIYSQMLADGVGYIQIAEFNTSMVPQFKEAFASLQEDGMESLVIDLRDNPGGDYDSVVSLCDFVLPEGPIVSVEDKMGGIHTENSDAQCLEMPAVLLVNGNTASAAELFTMAMHDYDMAQVVGTTTYGKGVVQSIFSLMDGSGLKFTTEKYYGPKGNYIQDTGIEPDHVVEIPDEAYDDGIITIYEDVQLQTAVQLLGLDPEVMIKALEEQEDLEEADYE